MVLLIVRGLLRRPSLSGTPTVTFCSVHIHNVVAKKRDASTELLQRLQGYMEKHNVDFIGSDFNMSALSTVGDVVSDPEFSAPGNSFLWGLGALEEQYRERTRLLIMPKRPKEWRVDSRGCYKFDNAALGFGPSWSIRSPSCVSPPSHHQSARPLQHHTQRTCTTKKKWNAGITNMTEREGDAHDCDPVRQGHVSAFLDSSSEFARESLACQFCSSTH